MTDAVHNEIRKRIANSQRIMIVAHIRPDGDAVGSLLSMGLGIRDLGKSVQMVLSDGVSASFRHLPGADLVVKRPDGDFDLIISVDCSDPRRVGPVLETYRMPEINIDHHITNLKFSEVNLIEPEAVATCEIITRHYESWGLTITPEIANALLMGIVTDTLGFRTSNMTPTALRVSAELMEKGGDLIDQYNRGLLRRSFEATSYWGAGLSGLQKKDRMVWGTLRLSDRKACAYPGNDDADLINVISSIDDFDISMIFVEQQNGTVKVSWRSVPGFNVSDIALSFGGGGHPAAAGADIPGTLEEIQPKVLTATIQLLESLTKNG